jgi:hypothetical protein
MDEAASCRQTVYCSHFLAASNCAWLRRADGACVLMCFFLNDETPPRPPSSCALLKGSALISLRPIQIKPATSSAWTPRNSRENRVGDGRRVPTDHVQRVELVRCAIHPVGTFLVGQSLFGLIVASLKFLFRLSRLDQRKRIVQPSIPALFRGPSPRAEARVGPSGRTRPRTANIRG